MWFWYFMLATTFLIPIAMIGFGARFMNKPPAKINSVYGYRTPMSMKNSDTWDFAHRYAGRVWYVSGWITLFASIPPMLFVMGKGTDTIGSTGALISLLQCIPLLGVIYATERALKKHFDKDGNRKQ